MKNNNQLADNIIFMQLIEVNYSKVKGFAYSILKSEFDAEDVAQEVFAKLWEQQGIWLNNERKLDPYLLIMARNIALNVFKHQQKEMEYQEWFINETSYIDDNFLEEIYYREMLQTIHAVLRKVPERRRIVFELSRFHGKSHNEIAERMNISVRTVEQQIYLTRIELRKVLVFLQLNGKHV